MVRHYHYKDVLPRTVLVYSIGEGSYNGCSTIRVPARVFLGGRARSPVQKLQFRSDLTV